MNKVLNHLEEWLVTFLMAGATLIIFAAVVHRYTLDFAASHHIDWLYDLFFGIRMYWAQELCIIMFVWMAKFGAAYGVRTGIHVGVDVLINRLQDKTRAKFILFGLAAGALFTAIVGTLGARFVWENGAHYAVFHSLGLDTGDLPEGPTTPDLEWPTWAVYCAVPFGSYLMCWRFLQTACNFMKTGELPHHDHGHVDGIEEEVVPLPGEEDRIYSMHSDNLHPHDMSFERRVAERRAHEADGINENQRKARSDRRKPASDAANSTTDKAGEPK